MLPNDFVIMECRVLTAQPSPPRRTAGGFRVCHSAAGLKLCFATAFLGLSLAHVLSMASPEPPGAIIEKLGDPDFAVREAASQELSRLGETAIPVLEQAKSSPDPEIRHRAAEILESFRFGILPDTPPALRAAMMELRRQSSEEGRRNEIRKLIQGGDKGIKSLERLVRLSRNNDESKQLLEAMSKELPEIIGALWKQGTPMDVRRFLEAFASRDEEILPEEIFKYLGVWDALFPKNPLLATSREKPLSASFALRAQGKFADAGKIATAIKNHDDLRSGFMVESGLWPEALIALKNSPLDEGDPEFLSLACMFEHLSGKNQEFDNYYEKYANHRDSTTINGPEKLPANLKILFLCDRPMKAIAKLKEFPPGQSYFQILSARMEMEEAIQLAKGKDGEKTPPELLIQSAKIQAILGKKKDALEAMTTLRTKIQPSESFPLAESMLEAALSQGLSDFAIESALLWLDNLKAEDLRTKIIAKATANDADKLGEICRLINILIAEAPDKNIRKGWLLFLLGKVPPDEAKDKISNLRNLIGRPAPKAQPPLRPAKLRQQLARLAHHYKMPETQFELLAPPHSDSEMALDYCACLIEAKQPDKAISFLMKFHEATPGNPRSWTLLSMAQNQMGKPVDAKQSLTAAMLIGAGDSRTLLEHLGEINEGENPSQSVAWCSILLQATLPGSFESGRVYRHLSRLQSRQKLFDQAAMSQLQSLLRASDPSVYFVSVGAYLASPVSYHRLRLEEALSKKDMGMARKEADIISQYLPFDVDLPISIHESAKTAETKALETPYYIKSRDQHRKLIKTYPESGWLRNSAAWLMACCQKDLEEAVEHATKATRLEPEKAGYWDTLAEAQFQSGKTQDAKISISQAVKLNPQKPYYKRQLQRIEGGNPAIPRSEEEDGD